MKGKNIFRWDNVVRYMELMNPVYGPEHGGLIAHGKML
jgi:hypothetical protein